MDKTLSHRKAVTLIFMLAGLCESGGEYLVWLWLRESRPPVRGHFLIAGGNGPPYKVLQAWWAKDVQIVTPVASGSKIIASGDKHLLNNSGFRGISILKPREFVDSHLTPR